MPESGGGSVVRRWESDSRRRASRRRTGATSQNPREAHLDATNVAQTSKSMSVSPNRCSPRRSNGARVCDPQRSPDTGAVSAREWMMAFEGCCGSQTRAPGVGAWLRYAGSRVFKFTAVPTIVRPGDLKAGAWLPTFKVPPAWTPAWARSCAEAVPRTRVESWPDPDLPCSRPRPAPQCQPSTRCH